MKTDSEKNDYLMENAEEIERLELKTNSSPLFRQARWAGLRPGMRVVDVGCGPGKTTSLLKEIVGAKGEAVGIDYSLERIEHATACYGAEGLSYVCRNVFEDLSNLGKFDFLWSRFFLEYHKTKCFEIIKKLGSLLKPGGILCLVDLDHNCLNHYGMSKRLEKSICGLVSHLEKKNDFDPFIGRKLYSYVYDLGYESIDVMLEAHHLIFGDLGQVDAFNWYKKVLVAGEKSQYGFEEYQGGFEEFVKEFEEFFGNPRRFTYTPLLVCKGIKPLS